MANVTIVPTTTTTSTGRANATGITRSESEQHSNHRPALVGPLRQHAEQEDSQQRAIGDRCDLQPDFDDAPNLWSDKTAKPNSKSAKKKVASRERCIRLFSSGFGRRRR